MLTNRELRNRAEMYNGRITRSPDGEYRVTLNEWRGREVERKAYYTDCAEDAIITMGDMRRREEASRAKIPVRNKVKDAFAA